MSDPQTVTMTLDRTEERFIRALRDLPQSPLRARVHRFMDEVGRFLQHPRCESMQADGVPCQNVANDCEHCGHMNEMLVQIFERARA